MVNKVIQSKAIRKTRQGGARAVDLSARLFDLARPGVAPPLDIGHRLGLAIVPWHSPPPFDEHRYPPMKIKTFLKYKIPKVTYPIMDVRM